MTHGNPAGPRRRRGARPAAASMRAAPPPDDARHPGTAAGTPGPADEPDTRGADPAQRPAAPAPAGAARGDIERVDEHTSGSIEAVPHATPAPGMASFSEPGEVDPGDGGAAP